MIVIFRIVPVVGNLEDSLLELETSQVPQLMSSDIYSKAQQIRLVAEGLSSKASILKGRGHHLQRCTKLRQLEQLSLRGATEVYRKSAYPKCTAVEACKG